MIPIAAEYDEVKKGWVFKLDFPDLKTREFDKETKKRKHITVDYFAPEITINEVLTRDQVREYQKVLAGSPSLTFNNYVGHREGTLRTFGSLTVKGFVRLLPRFENVLAVNSIDWQQMDSGRKPGTFNRVRQFDLGSGKSYRPNDAPASLDLSAPGYYGIVGTQQKTDDKGNPVFNRLGFMDDLRDIAAWLVKNSEKLLSFKEILDSAGISRDDFARIRKAQWVVWEGMGPYKPNKTLLEAFLKTDALSKTFDIQYVLRQNRWVPVLWEQWEASRKEVSHALNAFLIGRQIGEAKSYEEIEVIMSSHTIDIERRLFGRSHKDTVINIPVANRATICARAYSLANPNA